MCTQPKMPSSLTMRWVCDRDDPESFGQNVLFVHSDKCPRHVCVGMRRHSCVWLARWSFVFFSDGRTVQLSLPAACNLWGRQVEALILCDDGEPMFGEQKRCQKTIR